jgi:hypothetical protein
MYISSVACFLFAMNKRNGKAGATAICGRARPGRPSGRKRLRVIMKASHSWMVPLEKLAAQSSPRSRLLRIDPQRIEISVLRSVVQAGLRTSASHWGR